nr:ATP-binding protein [Streptomyces sp. B1I3]
MPRLPKGVPEARHRVQQALRDWGEPADRVEAAALVITELVTNAVQHTAGRRIRCRVMRTPGRVRICVWNRGRGRVPVPPRPADAAVGPRGPRAPQPRRPEPSHLPGQGAAPHGGHRTGGADATGAMEPPRALGADGPDPLGGPDTADGPDGRPGLDGLDHRVGPGDGEEIGDGEGFDDLGLATLAEDGRGLVLVDALAVRWGTRTSLSGRLVWADI